MKSNPLIVQLCPTYVDLTRETGGVATIVRHISLCLARMGRRVHLVCGNRELGKKSSAMGHEVHSSELTRTVLEQKSHPLLGPVSELRFILRELPQDCIVHVHTCFSAFTECAMAELRRRGVPYVFTPHGKLSGAMMSRHYLTKQLWWRLFARDQVAAASSITLSSSQEGGQLPALGVKQAACVIPNGYERQDVLSAPLIEGPYVLFFGYIDPRKQPDFLARAFAASRARATHKLVFAGPDAYGFQTTVKRVIQDRGIEDRVVWHGPAYGPSKWNLLSHAACLCLPSRAEGLPVVMSEALGAGLPIVYSKGCNFPDVQAQGAGLQLDRFVEEDWAQAIDSISFDLPMRRRMQQAAKQMGRDYTWDSIATKWCRLYDSLSSRTTSLAS
jgi:glycosyltransferase involved in cell wall biosynthesis